MQQIKLLYIKCFIAFAVLPLSSFAEGEVYVYHDKNHNLVFSDIKRKKSDAPLNNSLKALNTYPANQAHRITTKRNTHKKRVYSTNNNYQPAILNIKNNDTIRSNNGSVNIQTTIPQNLGHNHQVALKLNGKTHTTTDFTKDGKANFPLSLLNRGTHKIQAVIIDKSQNSVIAQSKPISLHMQRRSALHNRKKPTIIFLKHKPSPIIARSKARN